MRGVIALALVAPPPALPALPRRRLAAGLHLTARAEVYRLALDLAGALTSREHARCVRDLERARVTCAVDLPPLTHAASEASVARSARMLDAVAALPAADRAPVLLEVIDLLLDDPPDGSPWLDLHRALRRATWHVTTTESHRTTAARIVREEMDRG